MVLSAKNDDVTPGAIKSAALKVEKVIPSVPPHHVTGSVRPQALSLRGQVLRLKLKLFGYR